MTDEFQVIYSYSRQQAIEDGVLINVSATARQLGIVYPVAITDTVWHGYIEPSAKSKSLGQSVMGRLWDVLWMFRIKAHVKTAPRLHFQVYFLMDGKMELVELKAVCGPGDTPAPVITIMLPGED